MLYVGKNPMKISFILLGFNKTFKKQLTRKLNSLSPLHHFAVGCPVPERCKRVKLSADQYSEHCMFKKHLEFTIKIMESCSS